MALTPEEQAALDEMEAQLAASDPKLVHTLRGTPAIEVDRRRAGLGALCLVAGLGLLVAGMSTHWLVSIAGFVVMLAGALLGLTSWQRLEQPESADHGLPPVPTPQRDLRSERLDLWRRHHDDDED